MSKLIPLGPSLTGTLVAADIDATVAAYCDFLDAEVLESSEVSPDQATLWGKPALAGSPVVTLQSASGYPWIRIVHRYKSKLRHYRPKSSLSTQRPVLE